jgi:hypothetical protein
LFFLRDLELDILDEPVEFEFVDDCLLYLLGRKFGETVDDTASDIAPLPQAFVLLLKALHVVNIQKSYASCDKQHSFQDVDLGFVIHDSLLKYAKA